MSGAEEGREALGGGPHAAAAPAGEQLPLLPVEDPAAGDMRLPVAEAAKLKPLPKGTGGRPLGARNRRTDLVAEYLIGRYGDPLEASVSLGMMPLKDLVPTLRAAASDLGLKLGMSIGDILRLQAELRREALPYLHARRAPETAQGDPVLPVVGIGTYVAAQTVNIAGAGRSVEDVIEGEINQEVSDDAAGKSQIGEVTNEPTA